MVNNQRSSEALNPASSERVQARRLATTLALSVTIGLTILKLAVAKISGSVGILSEAIHSFLDLVSAAVAFYTVREAGKPADLEHPFGHGKFETLSSLLESMLLVAAAGFIVAEGVAHIRNPHPIEYPGWAIMTIVISLGVSFWAYRQNTQASRLTDSSAIQVNALHFLSDVIASAGVLAALILMQFTGWNWIDPVIAFVIAAYILLISAKQVKEALFELIDTKLPEEEIFEIEAILARFHDRVIEVHDLRTRKSGSTRHIDFHLSLCGWMSVHQSHAICDEMENDLIARFPDASVTIHVEPCSHHNPSGCQVDCEIQAKASPKPLTKE